MQIVMKGEERMNIWDIVPQKGIQITFVAEEKEYGL